MDRKIVIIIAAVGTGIAALTGAGCYSLPYLTLDRLKTATANRNADDLAKEIDFPALRTSIKSNIKTQVMAQIASNSTQATPAMGKELIDQMIEPLVDKMVTPKGLDELMQDKIPGAKLNLPNLEANIARSEIKTGYESPDRFVVNITDKVDRRKNVSFILKRDGLAWKLSGIDISEV